MEPISQYSCHPDTNSGLHCWWRFARIIVLVIFLLLSILGLAAVIYIDVVQVAIMLGGSSVLLYLGLDKVGGWDQLKTK